LEKEKHASKQLEKLYAIIGWVEDLSSVKGKSRFEEAVRVFRKVIAHLWIKDVLENKDKVSVLDVCGGTGVGGLAFSKVLQDKGVDVKLIVNDLRESALEKAKAFGKEILGKDVDVLLCDAAEIHRHGVKADIALLYGLSTPHFNPWSMVRLTVSVAKVLEPSGVFIVEESDRHYNVFYKVGYKDVLPEYVSENKVVLTIHSGYDVRKGVFKRTVLNLLSMDRALIEVHFWSIANTAALLWVFFDNIDFLPANSQTRGLVLAKKPRGLNPELYGSQPAMLEAE